MWVKGDAHGIPLSGGRGSLTRGGAVDEVALACLACVGWRGTAEGEVGTTDEVGCDDDTRQTFLEDEDLGEAVACHANARATHLVLAAR